MAGSKVTAFVFLVFGNFSAAFFRSIGATGMETASAGRICRRGNISLESYSIHLFIGVGVGYCGEQSLGVGVQRTPRTAVFAFLYIIK